MAKSIHTTRKSNVRKNKQAELGIVSAGYLRDYKLLVLFSTNRMKVIDFAPAIAKYAKGEFTIYADKSKFSTFHIENKNIVWGDNWDLIFPVSDIYNANF